MIKNPPHRSLLPSWNLDVVLDFLQNWPFEPVTKASLESITLKTVFLVAITTARRVSEIGALGRNSPYVREEQDGVRLRTRPGFLPKTATAEYLGQDIFLPSFRKNRLLCVKRMFKIYCAATATLAKFDKQEDPLFVLFSGSQRGKAASKGVISSWIRRVIKAAYAAAGRSLPSVKAHSTRAMGTSWALFNRATVESIMKAADWRRKLTFAKHYSLNLWKEKDGHFGRRVLNRN